jgi:GTPase SAR1 family protein
METLFIILQKTLKLPMGDFTIPLKVWQLAVLALLILLGYAGYVLYLFTVNKHKKLYFLEVRLPEITTQETAYYMSKMNAVFTSLHTIVSLQQDKLSFEVIKADAYITIQIVSNTEEILQQVKGIFSQIKQIQFKALQVDSLSTFPPFFAKQIATRKPLYSINSENNVFESILNYLSSLSDEEQAAVQFILRGVNKKTALNEQIHNIMMRAQQRKRQINEQEKALIEMFEEKQRGSIFLTKINLVATDHHILTSLLSFGQQLSEGTNTITSASESKENVLCRYISPDIPLINYLRGIFLSRHGSYLTSHELASIIHPTATERGKYAPHQGNIIEAAPEFSKEDEGNILLGTAESPNGGIQKIYFPLQNFARHLYIVGKTGRGKSTLITSLLKDLINKQRGTIFVFDPHGELLKDIITVSDHKERLVYLDINKKSSVFTMNPLFSFRTSFNEKEAIRDALLDVLQNETQDQTGDSKSGIATYNRIRHILDIGIHFADSYYGYLVRVKNVSPERATVLVNERQLTLNDLPNILDRDMKYIPLLKLLFKDVPSPVGLYVNRQLENHSNNAYVVEAVQTRLEQLLHSSMRLVCEGNKLNIQETIESGKVFLIPTPDSVYGSRGARSLMQFFFSLIWIHKQQREENRKNTYVFIDEFQKAQIHSIPDIISEGRKFKLFLALSNQQLGQLNEEIENSILGNMGTLISFTVAADDIGAKKLAPFFGTSVREKDLANLPPYLAYMRTEGLNQKPLATFSFKTIPKDNKEESNDSMNEVSRVSLETYGEDIATIEKKLFEKQSNPMKYFLEDLEAG